MEDFYSELFEEDFSYRHVFIEPKYDIAPIWWHHFAGGDSEHPIGSITLGEMLIAKIYTLLSDLTYWRKAPLLSWTRGRWVLRSRAAARGGAPRRQGGPGPQRERLRFHEAGAASPQWWCRRGYPGARSITRNMTTHHFSRQWSVASVWIHRPIGTPTRLTSPTSSGCARRVTFISQLPGLRYPKATVRQAVNHHRR